MQPLVRSLAPLALVLAACAASVDAGSPDPASDAPGTSDGADAATAIDTPCPGLATTWVRIDANLDSDAVTPSTPWDPRNPGATSNFSTYAMVWLAGGESSHVGVYFRRAQPGWSYHVMYGPGSALYEIAHGTLVFDTHGALANAALLTPVPLPDPRTGGTTSLVLDLGPETDHNGSIASGVTSIDGPSEVFAQRGDGCGRSIAQCPLAPIR